MWARVFTNLKNVEDAFGDDVKSEETQSAKDDQVLSTIVKDKTYNVNPIKLNVKADRLKKQRMFLRMNKWISVTHQEKMWVVNSTISILNIMLRIRLPKI